MQFWKPAQSDIISAQVNFGFAFAVRNNISLKIPDSFKKDLKRFFFVVVSTTVPYICKVN